MHCNLNRLIKKSSIFIGGNIYGAGNIGDDAILQGIVTLLLQSLPQCSVCVGTSQGRQLNFLPDDTEYFPVDLGNLRHVPEAVMKSDLFISGGGTLIGDELSTRFPLEYNARLLSTAKYYGKRTCMLAIGANELTRASSVKPTKAILASCDLMTFRDRQSWEVCNKLGMPAKTGHITADPAFLLKAHETPRTREIKQRIHSLGRCFGINVVNECWHSQIEYKKAIAVAVREVAKRHKMTPVLFATEVRQGQAFDNYANQQTAALLTCDHHIMPPVYLDPCEMIDVISQFDFVLAMRMHALIFAANAGVPFASVSRIDKVDNVLDLFGKRPAGTVTDCSPHEITDEIESILRYRTRFLRVIRKTVREQAEIFYANGQLLRRLTEGSHTDRRYSQDMMPYVSYAPSLTRTLHRLITGQVPLKKAKNALRRRLRKIRR